MGQQLQKHGKRKIWSYILLHSPLVDDLKGTLYTLLPKNWEAFGKYACNAKQCPDAQCSEQHLPG